MFSSGSKLVRPTPRPSRPPKRHRNRLPQKLIQPQRAPGVTRGRPRSDGHPGGQVGQGLVAHLGPVTETSAHHHRLVAAQRARPVHILGRRSGHTHPRCWSSVAKNALLARNAALIRSSLAICSHKRWVSASVAVMARSSRSSRLASSWRLPLRNTSRGMPTCPARGGSSAWDPPNGAASPRTDASSVLPHETLFGPTGPQFALRESGEPRRATGVERSGPTGCSATELDHRRKPPPQAGIDLQNPVHRLGITGPEHHQLVTMILHVQQQDVDDRVAP